MVIVQTIFMMFTDYKYRVNRPLSDASFSQAIEIVDKICDSLYVIEAVMKV